MNRTKSIYLALLTVLLSPMAASVTWAGPIFGETIDMSYTGKCFPSGSCSNSTSDTAVVGSGVEFTAPSPTGVPNLFDIDFTDNTLTITALASFTDPTFFSFDWMFTIQNSLLSFDAASLVSSSLFSAPPFTFPFDPTVSFDTVNRTLTVSRVLTSGINATATVNNGGQAVISFSTVSTTVPEPGTLALLGLGLVGMAARRKKKV